MTSNTLYCTCFVFQGTDGRRGPPGPAVSKFKHVFCCFYQITFPQIICSWTDFTRFYSFKLFHVLGSSWKAWSRWSCRGAWNWRTKGEGFIYLFFLTTSAGAMVRDLRVVAMPIWISFRFSSFLPLQMCLHFISCGERFFAVYDMGCTARMRVCCFVMDAGFQSEIPKVGFSMKCHKLCLRPFVALLREHMQWPLHIPLLGQRFPLMFTYAH